MYAEPGEAIIEDSSENDRDDRRARKPPSKKERITDGPAYRPAACPPSVYIPVPEVGHEEQVHSYQKRWFFIITDRSCHLNRCRLDDVNSTHLVVADIDREVLYSIRSNLSD